MGSSNGGNDMRVLWQGRAQLAAVLCGVVLTALCVPAIGQAQAAGGDPPGDANADGVVDLDNFSILKLRFGRTSCGTWAMGDFDADGDVDLDDFAILKVNFGATSQLEDLTLDLGDGVMMRLVRIPAGTFMMGSPETEQDRESVEGPQHQVTISQPFYMGVSEVTIDQYLAHLNDGGDPSGVDFASNWCPIEPYGTDYRMKAGVWWFWGNFDQPMIEVSWYGARSFCQWLPQRTGRTVTLPTEAQWEDACRAGSTTRFYYGDDPDYSFLGHYGWYGYQCGDGGYGTHAVSQKAPNAWGLYDMHGNVWEWCADWYGSYASANVVDPQGPASGSSRVVRGGSWAFCGHSCRSARRGLCTPSVTHNLSGFRVVVAPGGLD